MGVSCVHAISNTPVWHPCLEGPCRGFQEVWYLKLNAPDRARALWLRFTLLVRADGSKRVAETWAISFKPSGDTVEKVGVKQTYRLDESRIEADPAGTVFAAGPSAFGDQTLYGDIQSEQHRIRWELDMHPATPGGFDFVPASLAGRFVRNSAVTVYEDLRFSGWSEVDGERFEWRDAPGMQGHLAGPKNGHSWVWGHCNMFLDDAGNAVDCIWDGLSARARLGRCHATPPLTCMFVRLDGRDYCVNTAWRALRAKSSHDAMGWQFAFEDQGLSFLGNVQAAPEQFAGVTYEDTDGSHLYCYNSKISDMTLEIRRGGEMERLFHSTGAVAFEVVTREKREGVPLLI